MVFNVGNGLSEMGKSLNQTFQAYNVEAQKAELETQRLKLANDLAMERESLGRKETAAFAETAAEKQRGWQSGEFQLNRDSEERRTKMQNETSITTAGISAGAQLQAARENIAARASENEKHIAAQFKLANTFKLNDDGAASLVNPVDGKVTKLTDADGNAVKFSNPDVARAQGELVKLTTEQLSALTRQRATDLQQAQADLKEVMKPPGPMTNPNDPELQRARARVEQVKQQYDPQITALNQRLNSIAGQLATNGKLNVQGPGGSAKLSDFDRGPPPGPSGSPAAGSGLIDSW